MKKLFIHIGTHKTGTSSFQQVLFQKRHSLQKLENIHLIDLNEFNLINELKSSNEFSLNTAERLRDFLRRKMKRNGSFVISNERLSGCAYGEVYSNSRIIADTLKFAVVDYDVSIMVMFRRQDQFIQSLFMQMWHLGNSIDIDKFVNQLKFDFLDWNAFLKPWIENFGEKNVKVFPYDREVFKSLNIVQILNQEIESNVLNNVDIINIVNPGLSRNGLEIMKDLHNMLLEKDRRKLAKLLQALTNHENSEYNLINEELRDKIIYHFYQSNEELSLRYFYDQFGIKNFSEPLIGKHPTRNIREEYALLVQNLMESYNNSKKGATNNIYYTLLKSTKHFFKKTMVNLFSCHN